jgi:hypothetical protein
LPIASPLQYRQVDDGDAFAIETVVARDRPAADDRNFQRAEIAGRREAHGRPRRRFRRRREIVRRDRERHLIAGEGQIVDHAGRRHTRRGRERVDDRISKATVRRPIGVFLPRQRQAH